MNSLYGSSKSLDCLDAMVILYCLIQDKATNKVDPINCYYHAEWKILCFPHFNLIFGHFQKEKAMELGDW